MIIETNKDKNFLNHDFKAPWKKNISYEEWNKFLSHNYNYGREEAYKIIKKFLIGKDCLSFLEIGFGNCYDFEKCFKELDNLGFIDYNGWEITEQFVEYARKRYQSFYQNEKKFKIGCFENLNIENKYDIIYTRHTFEHQHPQNCYEYFSYMLKYTNKLAVIIWFKPPRKEKFTWNNRDGDGQGAYVNTYDRKKLDKIIKEYNFNLEVIPINYKNFHNELWKIEK